MKRCCALLAGLLCLLMAGCRQAVPQATTTSTSTSTTVVSRVTDKTETATTFVSTVHSTESTQTAATESVGSTKTESVGSTTVASTTVTTVKHTAAATTAVKTTATTRTSTTAATVTTVPTTTAKTTVHTCAYAAWTLKKAATCTSEGQEQRTCAVCGSIESRPISKAAHAFSGIGVCKKCGCVRPHSVVSVAELGVPTSERYGVGAAANTVWDVKIQNGYVYRGAGDYDENSGYAPVFAYGIQTQTWLETAVVPDEAVHRFIEWNGTLLVPGTDPIAGWDLGNYYVLENDTWKTVRTIPNGVHNFDMVAFGGKLFAGVGTENFDNTVAVSTDGKFSFVPLYKDGELLDTSSYQWSRTYEFAVYNDTLYALIAFRKATGSQAMLFRYENGQMVFVANVAALTKGKSYNRNYWNGKFEFKGTYYLTAQQLYAITDFDTPASYQTRRMPNGETVVDALVYDGAMYVLGFTQDTATSEYDMVIYRSETGANGSFEKVLEFRYPAYPCSFDTDGEHFYVGTAAAVTDPQKTGMLLQVCQ